MPTILYLDDEIHKRFKTYCAENGVTMRNTLDFMVGTMLNNGIDLSKVEKKYVPEAREKLSVGRPRKAEKTLSQSDLNATYPWDERTPDILQNACKESPIVADMDFLDMGNGFCMAHRDSIMARALSCILSRNPAGGMISRSRRDDIIKRINFKLAHVTVDIIPAMPRYFYPVDEMAVDLLRIIGKTRTAYTSGEMALLAEAGFSIAYRNIPDLLTA